MTTIDIITLVIAIYGAGVATVLGIRKIRSDRRRITVILEHIAFYERAQITIINIGFRPITLSEIGMAVGEEQNGKLIWDQVPRNALFGPEVEAEPLPATLGDGEHLSILLSDPVSRALFDNKMRAKVSVYDAEGKVYTDFKTRLYNPKWGHYGEM